MESAIIFTAKTGDWKLESIMIVEVMNKIAFGGELRKLEQILHSGKHTVSEVF